MDKRVFGGVRRKINRRTEPFYQVVENGPQMRPSIVLGVVLLLAGTAGAVVSTPQSSEYSMTSPDEVEIPARNLTVDGEDYTVGAIGRVDPGDTIRVDVSAPEDAEYSVYLYDKDLRVEAIDSMTGSGRATFSTDALSPGSYLAAVYTGEILEVFPVVVEGYGATVDAPGAASAAFDVNVSVADGALTSDPPEVQVVVGDDERSVRVTADRVADGEYRATVPTDGFDPDTYALYGVVRGEGTTEGGDRVILAVSDRREIDVVEPMSSTPTATPDDGDGGGGGQPGGGDGGEVEVQESTLLNGTVAAGEPVALRVDLRNSDPAAGRITLTLTANGTTVAERTVTVDASTERTVLLRTRFDTHGRYALALDGEALGTVTVTAAPTETPTDAPTGTGTARPTPTPTEEAVVTPRPTTEPPSSPDPTTTSGDGAGFGAGAAALAVALGVLALARRR
jgi:hypothetical protein